MTEIYPWEYTDKEGGDFKLWDGTPVTRKELRNARRWRQRRTPEMTTIRFHGRNVHSLIFETAVAGHGAYGRWDCVNGWTITIAQAKRRMPQGYHGQKPKVYAGQSND